MPDFLINWIAQALILPSGSGVEWPDDQENKLHPTNHNFNQLFGINILLSNKLKNQTFPPNKSRHKRLTITSGLISTVSHENTVRI